MNTLLALVNNPADSEDFIRYAALMAADMGYNLQLLYVLNPAGYTLTTGTAAATAHPAGTEIDILRINEEQRIATAAIREKVEKIPREALSGISVNVDSEAGAMDMVVDRYLEDNRADVVLVENRHEEGSWILDTGTQLIMNINCPGWLIPRGAVYKSPQKIIYATDFNKRDPESIKKLIEFTGAFSPRITVLHVMDKDDQKEREKLSELRQKITTGSAYENIEVVSLIDEQDKGLAENLNEYAENAGAQLIVLLKENKSFFERIFQPGPAKKVIKKVMLPLLVYHEKEFK
jgi:nucleotide-binding universal stress UspA family protein